MTTICVSVAAWSHGPATIVAWLVLAKASSRREIRNRFKRFITVFLRFHRS